MSKGGVGGGQQTPFGGQSQSFYHQRPPSFRSPGPIRPPYFRDPPVGGPPPFRPPMRNQLDSRISDRAYLHGSTPPQQQQQAGETGVGTEWLCTTQSALQ